MFFQGEGRKHGEINGEALDQKHKNEIEVLAWSWGMQGKSSLGGGRRDRQGDDARIAHHQESGQVVDRADVRAAHQRADQRSDADATKIARLRSST
jgi:type VI protein secretion system component Hcp